MMGQAKKPNLSERNVSGKKNGAAGLVIIYDDKEKTNMTTLDLPSWQGSPIFTILSEGKGEGFVVG